MAQGFDDVQPMLHHVAIPHRRIQPRPQLPSAHRRGGVIHHREQGAGSFAVEAAVDLQVTPRVLVHHHHVRFGDLGQPVHERQVLATRRLGVAQYRRRRAHGHIVLRQAERIEVGNAEVVGQVAEAQLGIELHGVVRLQRRIDVQFRIVRRQHFSGAQSRQRGRQRGVAVGAGEGELARGEVQPGDGPARRRRRDAGQNAVVIRGQQAVFGQRAGRHHALHAPLDRPLGAGRIADLLADGHRSAFLHQLRQVTIDGMERHPGHGNRAAARLATRRQRDVQQAGGFLGIVEEQLVEVAHAIEEKGVGMLRFDTQILLHHRRVH